MFFDRQRIETKLQNRDGDMKNKRLCGQGRRQGRGPAEAFGVSENQLEFAKSVSDALPLQVAADFKAPPRAADPREA